MGKRLITWLIVVGALGLVGFYFASPLLAVHNLVEAAKAGDARRLERMVDFPAFRDSLKAELGAEVRDRISDRLGEEAGGLAGLGMMFAPAIVSGAVDALVTPQSVAAMVQTAEAPTPSNPRPRAETGEGDDIRRAYAYRGLDEFVLTLTDPDYPDRRLDLLMQRRGVFSWKLVGLDIDPER